ncbi:hypothetical protein [Actinacidiphila soli]|uniref:hypothetical protein n=1 Tax=Actinacidiphila soli TaxID=2487275 RepID=UPI000FCC59BC|nr:hypothetical protein [Actinacidiphila soli]
MWSELKGAEVAEVELPIPGYGELTGIDVTYRLPRLAQVELATIEGYERAHTGRSTILNKIADLRGSEPWPGYDSMKADEIRTLMHVADADLARQVLDKAGLCSANCRPGAGSESRFAAPASAGRDRPRCG